MPRNRTISATTLAVIGYVSLRNDSVFGSEIIDVLQLKSGTVYPILSRLVAEGIVKTTCEKGDTVKLGRP